MYFVEIDLLLPYRVSQDWIFCCLIGFAPYVKRPVVPERFKRMLDQSQSEYLPVQRLSIGQS